MEQALSPEPRSSAALARIETELGLRDYQRDALRAFVARGGRGIMHMATGTGKTLVGIGAILWARAAGERALVIVPTRALMHQWRTEVVRRGGLTPDEVRCVGGSRRLRRLEGAAVVITPIQTAMRNPDALSRMAREWQRTLLIVDECHRAGASKFSRALVQGFPYRLGLSATPERNYDPVGTRKVFDYFRGVAHTYELGRAVDEGHLARYTYHLHSTYLTEDEARFHEALTVEIGQVVKWIKQRYDDAPSLHELGELLAFLRSNADDPAALAAADELQRLLFQRARIVKNAAGKLDVFRRLAGGLHGRKTIVFSEEISLAEQLGAIAREAGLEPVLYHSLMRPRERDAALDHYRRAESGVLLAVRALDEGLDVPDADVAVLAASSTSERQHIQRRGRVLRPLLARHKTAELHDFYVIGVDDADRVARIREDAEVVQYHGFEEPLTDYARFDPVFAEARHDDGPEAMT